MTADSLQNLLPNVVIHPLSLQYLDGETFALFRRNNQDWLAIVSQSTLKHGARFEGEIQKRGEITIKICPTSHLNAVALRELFSFTAPQPIGLRTSFGVGDRLGLAAPAHLQAARQAGAKGRSDDSFALVLAQQSMREMARTQRTPDEVLDAATWGAFRENWQAPWGADADHLKTESDIQTMAAAGFTFFTIDPSEHVDDEADNYASHQLQARFDKLKNAEELRAIYENQSFEIGAAEPFSILFTPEILQRAAVKYARAVDHTQAMAKVLCRFKIDFDLEMSVDETDSPTGVEEHFFIAHELKRREVRVQSLALRFVGEFQKGIDYIGALQEFETELQQHFAVAQQLGPYKISIHSGSDKFSIFPIFARVCGALIHEKTAGTWYLEALRAVARVEPALFREICQFARGRFPAERATYHVTESLGHLADFSTLPDNELESVLDDNAGRQMLHVSFGSVLTDKVDGGDWRFRTRLYELWQRQEALHHDIVRVHSLRHLRALGMAD